MASRPTVRVEVRSRSRIKVSTIAKFPAQVVAGDGIDVAQSGGVFTFSLDAGFTPSFATGLPFTVGDILVAEGAASVATVHDVATGNVLLSGGAGAPPSYGKVGLTTHVSGILPPFNGGTGIANANTLTLSGADAAFTFSGATSVTFPTTGMLATRAGSEALTNKTYNGNTWTAGTGTLTIAAGKTLAVGNTLTFTGADGSAVAFGTGGTVSYVGVTETFTGVKTFGSAGAVGRLRIAGTTSGTTILDATAIASGTLTLPAATDTLVGKATTDTLTNKTFDTAGSGNVFRVGGNAISGVSGSGSNVLLSGNPLVTAITIAGSSSGAIQLAVPAVAGANVWTLQAATDTFVGRATTDTLTGKSISGSANTITNIGGASIRMGSDAQGDVLYFNGTNYVRLGAGASGHFLKTLGAGANPAWAAVPGGGDLLSTNNLSDVDDIEESRLNLRAGPLYGYFYGLTLSNDVTDPNNDIVIAAGRAASDSATPVLITLASAVTKRLDANWAVGNNQGGLDAGAKANNTSYSLWAIRRSDTGVVDALFSASGTAPTMPTNYDHKKYLGQVVTDGSGNIRAFVQTGQFFRLTSPSADYSTGGGGTVDDQTFAATLTAVPVGRSVRLLLGVRMFHATLSSLIYIRNPSDPDIAPLFAQPSTLGNGEGGFSYTSQAIVWCNTSRQIAMRANRAAVLIDVSVVEWFDPHV